MAIEYTLPPEVSRSRTQSKLSRSQIWGGTRGKMFKLTHWGQDKIATILQTTFSNAFYCHYRNQRWSVYWRIYIDGLVQERCNSIANALELSLSCTNPLICVTWFQWVKPKLGYILYFAQNNSAKFFFNFVSFPNDMKCHTLLSHSQVRKEHSVSHGFQLIGRSALWTLILKV